MAFSLKVHFFCIFLPKYLHISNFFFTFASYLEKEINQVLTITPKSRKGNSNMKTIKTYLNENSVIAFKIYGGGGNRRKLVCLGEHKIGDFTDDLFSPVDEEGNDIEGEYIDEAGNPVGLTTEDVRNGIGCIDIDGEYNTTYTKHLGDIDYDSDEAHAMVHKYSELNEDWVVGYFCNGKSEEAAKAIIGELGLDIEDYFEDEDEEEA